MVPLGRPYGREAPRSGGNAAWTRVRGRTRAGEVTPPPLLVAVFLFSRTQDVNVTGVPRGAWFFPGPWYSWVPGGLDPPLVTCLGFLERRKRATQRGWG